MNLRCLLETSLFRTIGSFSIDADDTLIQHHGPYYLLANDENEAIAKTIDLGEYGVASAEEVLPDDEEAFEAFLEGISDYDETFRDYKQTLALAIFYGFGPAEFQRWARYLGDASYWYQHRYVKNFLNYFASVMGKSAAMKLDKRNSELESDHLWWEDEWH